MVVVVVSFLFAYRRLSGILCDDDPSHTLLSSSEVSGYLIVVDPFFLADHDEGRMKGPSLVWFMGIAAMLGVFSGCTLFSRSTGHISVKAVSWKQVKKYAEPEAGLVGHKITIIDRSDGQVVAEKLTDDLGYAIFDVPAGSYTVTGIGGEPQNVVVSLGQTVGFKLIVH
jgi:hypothetical protein